MRSMARATMSHPSLGCPCCFADTRTTRSSVGEQVTRQRAIAFERSPFFNVLKEERVDTVVLLAVILGLAALGALAQVFGVDSRPWSTEEENRPWL
jgi:hypothetical protein